MLSFEPSLASETSAVPLCKEGLIVVRVKGLNYSIGMASWNLRGTESLSGPDAEVAEFEKKNE
jgi:hypothetical protein